jgi:hypothetical protein
MMECWEGRGSRVEDGGSRIEDSGLSVGQILAIGEVQVTGGRLLDFERASINFKHNASTTIRFAPRFLLFRL